MKRKAIKDAGPQRPKRVVKLDSTTVRLYYTGLVGYPIRAMWPEFAMPFVALRFHHIMYDVVGIK